MIKGPREWYDKPLRPWRGHKFWLNTPGNTGMRYSRLDARREGIIRDWLRGVVIADMAARFGISNGAMDRFLVRLRAEGAIQSRQSRRGRKPKPKPINPVNPPENGVAPMFEAFECASADEVRSRARALALRRRLAWAGKPKRVTLVGTPHKTANAAHEPSQGLGVAIANPGRPPTMEEILMATHRAHHVSRIDLISRRREMPLAKIRQACAYVMRRETAHTFPEIGRHIGGRDHSTIIHSVHKVEGCTRRMGLVRPILRELYGTTLRPTGEVK